MKFSSQIEIVNKPILQTCVAIGLAGMLSACSDDSPFPDASTPGDTIAVPTEVKPSVSAAELANDGTNSLSFAQAVGAGTVVPDSANATTTEASNVAPDSENSIAGAQNSSASNSTASGTVGNVLPEAQSPVSTTTGAQTAANSASDSTSTDSESLATDSVAGPSGASTASNSFIDPSTIEASQASAEIEAAQSNFVASTTQGFTGEVLDDGSVQVQWPVDPTARGYNVYRQAEYIETVWTNEYLHTDTFDEDYYYEIQSFDFADNFSLIATGLTVKVRDTGRINPAAITASNNLLNDYELVFSDEFNGSELDDAKWDTSYIWGDHLIINSEEQFYVDILNKPDFGYNPFQFDGENLIISSIKTPANLLEKAQDQPYLSGVLTSYDAFKFTYGFVETRAKVVSGQGYWPAFWLLNAYYDKDKPEIDIMEHIGDDQDVVYHTYHYYDSEGVLRSTKTDPSVGVDFPAEFHTYAVEWSPGRIIYYVDGIEQHRIEDPKVSSEEMYIIANTAIGGWWPGSPDETTPFPGEYKIDYIRAYQRVGIQDDMPLFDNPESEIPDATTIPGQAPNHIPPYHLWPQGYPERPQE